MAKKKLMVRAETVNGSVATAVDESISQATEKPATADMRDDMNQSQFSMNQDTVTGLSTDPGPTKQPQSKLVLPELETGGIDLGSMRPKTVDRLKQAIRLTPDLFDEAKKTGGGFKEIPDSMVDMVHTGLCKAGGYAAARLIGERMASELWKMSDEELKTLRQPTKDFINRRFPNLLDKLPDAEFIGAILSVYAGKLAGTILIYRQMQGAANGSPATT